MKKHLFSVISSAAAVSLLAACSGSDDKASSTAEVEVNKEGFPIVDEKITMSMFGPSTGLQEWKNMSFFQEMEELTNISFDFRTPNLDSAPTQKNLMFASEDYTDIIFGGGLTREEQVQYGGQGVLIPLEDLIAEYAPNIQQMFEEYPEVLKSVTATDGHIYALPTVSIGENWYRGPLWYNGAFLEALDISEDELPTTTDELYDLLVRFKEEDPNGNGEADEIPLTGHTMDDLRQFFLGAFGVLESDEGIYILDDEVYYGPIESGYQAYLEYMHKLYADGLLDPETFSQTDEQKKGKGQANQVGLFADWFPFFMLGTPENGTENPMMPPITSELVDEPVIPMSSGITVGSFAITNSAENPEAAIRWVDYLYSKEGSTLLNIGGEGELWEWADEENQIRRQKETPPNFNSSEDFRGTLTPDYGIAVPRLSFDIEWDEENEFSDWIREETEKKIHPVGHVGVPGMFLTSEEQRDANRIRSDLDAYVEQMEAKFITGQETLSNWDTYVQTIENMNVERLIEIYADAYERYQQADEQ